VFKINFVITLHTYMALNYHKIQDYCPQYTDEFI
jgi:hypothetical protein